MKGGTRPPGKNLADFRKNVNGFTIVEVMIVLAVSGLIFVSAALMIAGRQNRVGFTTSINDAKDEVQQVINDVSNGFYPNAGNFKCQQGAPGSPPTITYISNSNSQGTNASGLNSGCVFLGKVMQFAVSNSSDATSPVINIYPVVGNLGSSTDVGLPAQTLQDSVPEILDNGSPSEQYTLRYGIDVKGMCYTTTTSSCNAGQASEVNPVAMVVFATSLATTSPSSLPSGTQTMDMLPVLSTSLGDNDDTSGANCQLAQQSSCSFPPVLPPGNVEICLEDKSTNESGLITIGGNSGVPAVNMSVEGNTTCS